MVLFHYLKYWLIFIIGVISLIAVLAAGQWFAYGLLFVVLFFVVGDAIAGDDTTTPKLNFPMLLTVQLWLTLPLLSLIVFSFIWSVSDGDKFGYGAWLETLIEYPFIQAKADTSSGQHIAGIFLVGLMIGSLGTITAHELTHRTWDKISLVIGRLLLAFSFDTIFSIEHVYGHHRYVATKNDPATAPRGRNVYAHIWISTIKGNLSAWQIEKLRLHRNNKPLLSLSNAVIRGHLLSIILLVIAAWMGGLVGALFFVACAVWGKALLEIVNYMEHYGIVRLADAPVEPRHSWNTNKRISSWAMFNLTRHSHHHAQGEIPYQDLKPFPEAPTMISGYLTTIIIAMIPPLWFKLMAPKLQEWDARYASEQERGLIEANSLGD